MKHVCIDDRGNYIICGLIIDDKNPNTLISESLKNNGLNPKIKEFISGISYRKYPSMSKVRSEIKLIIKVVFLEYKE